MDGRVVESPGLCATVREVRDGRAHHGKFEPGMGGTVESEWQGMNRNAVVCGQWQDTT